MAKFQVAFCLLVAFTVMLQVEAGYLYPRKEFDGESSSPKDRTKHTKANVPISCFYLRYDSVQKKRKSNYLCIIQ